MKNQSFQEQSFLHEHRTASCLEIPDGVTQDKT